MLYLRELLKKRKEKKWRNMLCSESWITIFLVCGRFICLITNEIMVYGLRKTNEHSVTLWCIHDSAFPCFFFVFFFPHTVTGNRTCKQGNVSSVRRMHTLWLPHNANTSLTSITSASETSLRPGASVQGIFPRSTKRDCHGPRWGRGGTPTLL